MASPVPPTFEAAIYLQNASAPVWPILARAADNLLVISADPTAHYAGPPSRVCACLPDEFGIAVMVRIRIICCEHSETIAGIAANTYA